MSSIDSYKMMLGGDVDKYVEGVARCSAKNALFETVLLDHYLEDMAKTVRLLVTMKLVSRAKNAQALVAYPLRERGENPIRTFLFVQELTSEMTMEQTEVFQSAW
jgi:hypothetical protein